MPLLLYAERLARRALNATGLESRWVQTRLANHHVYDARGKGSLPTVVILHGFGSAATPFARVIQRLRPHVRRVLAPEAPGHGFSGQPNAELTPESLFETMTELLDRELDEPAILFGNSLGGGVALRYAIARPDRVAGLFLSSPAGAPMNTEELQRFLALFQIRSKAEARAFLQRIYHRPPWFSPLLAAALPELFSREVIRTFLAAAPSAQLFTPGELGALKIPIHLAWGMSERLLPEASFEFFRKTLPSHTTIERPEGVGHCPHLDAPEALAEAILAFAREVGATR